MNSYFGLNWLSYLLTGVLALVASSLLSGCVFGNNEVDQTAPWDGVTGYYDTQPGSISFCVMFTGQTQATCADGAFDQLSSSITSALTDPLGLKLLDSLGDTAFYNPESTSGGSLTLVVNSGTLAITPPAGTAPNTYQAWPTVQDCNETDLETASGQITRYTGAAHASQGYTITGRVTISYQNSSAFSAGCSAALTAMTSCYENVADCGGGTQEENGLLQQSLDNLYTTLINPAVDLDLVSLTTGAGAPTNSIANLTSVYVAVTYQ